MINVLKRIATLFSLLIIIAAGIGGVANTYAEENVRLQLKWFHGWQFAGYYAAQKKGFYSVEGLNVTIMERSLKSSHIDTVLDGDAEYGVSDSSIVLHRLQERPVVALAAVFQHSPLVLMTLAEDGLIGPHELKGKRVMTQRGIDDAAITAMFTLLGLPEDYYQHIDHSFDDDALIKGDVDAMSAYLTNQPLQYVRRGYQVNVINPANYGIDFYGDTLFTSEAELKQYPDRVKRFVKASLKGWHYALKHKEEVHQWLRDDFGIVEDDDYLIAEAEAIERMIIPELVEIGYLNPARYERIADIYKSLGMSKNDAELRGIYIDDYGDGSYPFKLWLQWIIAPLIIFLTVIVVMLIINRRLSHLVKERTQELYQLSVTDHLTGLNNRKLLEQVLTYEISRTERYLRPFAVMLIDADHFKQINDNYGHQLGDKVLVGLADILQKSFRQTDTVGRWGGEEFLVICPEIDKEQAFNMANTLRKAIESYDFDSAIKVTVSVGVALQAEEGSLEALISRADKALYQAKEAGRNRVEFSD